MAQNFETRETGNGAAQKIPPNSDAPKFSLSETDQIVEGDGDWGFSILADKNVFIASVSYPTQVAAIRGRIAMAQALEEAVSVGTSES